MSNRRRSQADTLSTLLDIPSSAGSKGIRTLEERIVRVESVLILLGIGAIASGDYLFGPEVSLGYLYLIPLSYSALSHRWFITLPLVVICVILRQWLGPLEFASWGLIARDWILTALFLSVVTALYRLGRSRHHFFESARIQRDELVREIKLAADVQQQLLSRNQPPKDQFEISARTYPAKVVGGDYYDFIPLDTNRTGVVIADVSGKGLPAAMLMPAVQIALRTIAAGDDDVRRIITELNSVFYEATELSSYATLFFGILDLKTGRFDYVNAGHQPPLFLRNQNQDFDELTLGGPPVGLLPDSDYESGSVTLQNQDLLVLFTDGVIEAEDRKGEFYEKERLRQIIEDNRSKSAENVIQQIQEDIVRFSGTDSHSDDLTIIVIRSRGGSDHDSG